MDESTISSPLPLIESFEPRFEWKTYKHFSIFPSVFINVQYVRRRYIVNICVIVRASFGLDGEPIFIPVSLLLRHRETVVEFDKGTHASVFNFCFLKYGKSALDEFFLGINLLQPFFRLQVRLVLCIVV